MAAGSLLILLDDIATNPEDMVQRAIPRVAPREPTRR